MGDDLDELSLEDIYEVDYHSKPDNESFAELSRRNDDEKPLRSLSNLRRVGLDQPKGLSIATSAQWAVANGRHFSFSRPIPHPQSGLSVSHSEPPRQIVQSSAPVNVPNWGKILGTRDKPPAEPEDEDEEGDDMEPPHIRVQRQLKKDNDGLAISFSVCEGKGRTLKGLDQVRMRRFVLQKTGFLNQAEVDEAGFN